MTVIVQSLKGGNYDELKTLELNELCKKYMINDEHLLKTVLTHLK